MKEMSLQEHLRSLGAHNGFFGSGLSGTFIGYDPMGEFGFQALESGLINKFKKQFIPMTEVFPKNRKKILLSLPGFDANRFINLYGIGSPQQVYKNYQKACTEISKQIHKKIQKKVVGGEDYNSAFYEEEEDFDKLKIYKKYKIFSSEKYLLPEDLDCSLLESEEWLKYNDQENWWIDEFGMEARETFFPFPYKEKKTASALEECFLIKYKKYSFIISFEALSFNAKTVTIKI